MGGAFVKKKRGGNLGPILEIPNHGEKSSCAQCEGEEEKNIPGKKEWFLEDFQVSVPGGKGRKCTEGTSLGLSSGGKKGQKGTPPPESKKGKKRRGEEK